MKETRMISKISGVLMVLFLTGLVLGCGASGGGNSLGGVFSLGGKIIGPGSSGVEMVLTGHKNAVSKTDKDGVFLFSALNKGTYSIKAGALAIDAKDVETYKIETSSRVVTIEGKSVTDVIFYVEYKSSSSPAAPTNPTNPTQEVNPTPNPTNEVTPIPNPTEEATQDPKPIEPSVNPISSYTISGFVGGGLPGVNINLYSYVFREVLTVNSENIIISPNKTIFSNPVDTPIKQFVTADDGCFYFEGLPAGKYVLKAEKFGYTFQPKYYEINLPEDERRIDFEPVISEMPLPTTDKILLEKEPTGLGPIYTPANGPIENPFVETLK